MGILKNMQNVDDFLDLEVGIDEVLHCLKHPGLLEFVVV